MNTLSTKQYSYSFNNQVVKVLQDLDGCASGGTSHEPAWSFRLWDGAVALSRYLETIADDITGKHVIELGTGTGLVSLVLGELGAEKVIATDLDHAMPLLQFNISHNNPEESNGAPHSGSEQYKASCPGHHTLTDIIADCEDYMCNVCDEDIDEGGHMQRCVECNFDICGRCLARLSSPGGLNDMPAWFQVQVLSGLPDGSESVEKSEKSKNDKVIGVAYDWSRQDSLASLMGVVHRVCPSGIEYLIASDVTYSEDSVKRFFTAVQQLLRELRKMGSSRSPITFMFSHHVRSASTNSCMLENLRQLVVANSPASETPTYKEISASRCGADDNSNEFIFTSEDIALDSSCSVQGSPSADTEESMRRAAASSEIKIYVAIL